MIPIALVGAAGFVVGGIASPILIVVIMIRIAHRAYGKAGDQ